MKSWEFAKSNKVLSIFVIVLLVVNLRIVSNTFYVDENSVIHTTLEGYGDLPLHLGQMSKFAYGPFDLNEPIYYGAKLQYPFLLNLIRGLILAITGSWTISVLWPLYILVIGNIILTYIIYFKISKDKFISYLASLIFFLGSGLHWYYELAKGQAENTFYLNLHYPLQNIAYGPTMVSIVHQHTFHLGLFLFLLLMYFILEYSFTNKWINIISVIILGILPIAHIHSFLAIGLFLSIYFISKVISKDFVLAKRSFFVGFSGLIISIPQLLFLLGGRVGQGFSHLRLGWMIEKGYGGANFATDTHTVFSFSYLNFIWINFGLIIPIAILATLCLFAILKVSKGGYKVDIGIMLFAITSFAIFILANLYQFQPWDYDNNKLLIYFVFFISVFALHIIGIFIAKFIPNITFKYIILSLVTLFICISGMVDVYRRFTVPQDDLVVVFERDYIEMGDYISKNTDKNKTIISSLEHRNPAIALGGRQGVIGYDGWLWSRGIDYNERKKEVEAFFNDPQSAGSIFAKYKIGYILVDEKVKLNRHVVSYFDQKFKKIKENERFILYQII